MHGVREDRVGVMVGVPGENVADKERRCYGCGMFCGRG